MATFKKLLPYIMIIAGLIPLIAWGVADYIHKHQRIETFTAYTDNEVSADKSADWSLVKEFNETRNKDIYSKIDNSSNLIGYIEIKALDLREPIYKFATDKNLETGVAHAEQTDIPIENSLTESLIIGHNGTVGKPFFTHLDDLKEGDIVTLQIMDKTFTYKVISKETVEPEKVHTVKPEDKSTLTLVTCTPYGVNSHRLLVHCVAE